MKPPVDLPVAPMLCVSAGSPKPGPGSAGKLRFIPTGSSIALAAATLLPLVAASSLSAQDYWPPDDPSPGPSQPYQPSPQYADNSPQYPQTPYPSSAQPYGYPQQGYGQQLGEMPQAVSPEQLTQLVAPIALYPDNLVAEILAASTYPAQIAAADQWLRSMNGAPPEQIAAGADAQSSWDPSIKALTAFPQVLSWLASNLQWTTRLGNAYYNQPQDVLQTIQVMRQRAEDAGNLQSTPQEQVSEDQGAIDIAPANPEVVYVPTYNPWTAYGAPVDPYPGFSLLGAVDSFFGSSAVQFGLSFAMNAFMHTPWGFLGWGLDWIAHSVLFNHASYCTHSDSVRDWGFPHGGPRAYPGNPQFIHGGYGRYGSERAWNHGYGSGNWNRYGAARSGYAPTFGRPSSTYRGPVQGFNRYGQTFGRSPFYGDARSAEGFNHGFPPRTAFPIRPPQEAYNRYPQPVTRAPQLGGSYGSRYGEGSRAYLPPRQSFYGNHSGMNSGGQSFAPQNAYRGSDNARAGREYSHSSGGGFHLFGNHNSDGYGGGRAPRSYSFGGGHSSWGGGGGGWKAPHESSHFGSSHFGGGGGHWGGGGGHFGGGGNSSSHSGGGHSGGHHH